MAKKNKTPRINKVSLSRPSADHSILFHVSPLKSNVTKCNLYRWIMNVIIVMGVFSYLNSIVMFSSKFFVFNVRCIVPMGGQRGFFGFAA